MPKISRAQRQHAVREAYRAGEPPVNIGRRMGLAGDHVWRLVLGQGGVAVRSAGRTSDRARAFRPTPHVNGVSTRWPPRVVAEADPAPPRPPVSPVRYRPVRSPAAAEPCEIWQLRANDQRCRYIVDDTVLTGMYCGAAVAQPGCSWCEFHLRIVSAGLAPR